MSQTSELAGSGAGPEGYLGADTGRVAGPAPELVEAGYALELADAPLLHYGLGLADLAHVLGLAEAGVIPGPDAARLAAELLAMLQTPAGEFPYLAEYGDAYNSRERELERRIGAVAGWLHAGRTRREAGRIAFRLALRERALDLHEAVGAFIAACVAQARAHAGTGWADTTYLQPAQPSTFGHYLASFGEEASRDLDRLRRVHEWADTSPAGSGGVAGSRVPADRARLADRLGFAGPAANTRDGMWATDGLADAAFAAAQAATTVSRLAKDLEVLTSPGFGYVTLDASLCRASVLLPQKRNPYALAVIRAGAGTLIGRAAGALVTRRTPSARTDNWLHGYGEAAGALELARRVVRLAAAAIGTLQVHADVLAAAAADNFTTAGDLAEEIVLRHGADYRTAYRVVGSSVSAAAGAGRTTLTEADMAAGVISAGLAAGVIDIAAVLAAVRPGDLVTGRSVPGGSAPDLVLAHCADLAERNAGAARWREERRRRAAMTERELLAAARALIAQHQLGDLFRAAAGSGYREALTRGDNQGTRNHLLGDDNFVNMSGTEDLPQPSSPDVDVPESRNPPMRGRLISEQIADLARLASASARDDAARRSPYSVRAPRRAARSLQILTPAARRMIKVSATAPRNLALRTL